MIKVTEIENEELLIEGSMKEGEKINGLCCDGYDCEVIDMIHFDESDPNDVSVWFGCESPSHDEARVNDMYAGVKSMMIEDIACWMVDND